MIFVMWLFVFNWKKVFNDERLNERIDIEMYLDNNNKSNLENFKNFVSVFGNNPLVWFLPFCSTYEGECLFLNDKNF
jgi:hypothetical protein